MPDETNPTQTVSAEDEQMLQTIEMFEVITTAQPLDVQSLEILRDAYAKLGREFDLTNTSRRIAEAYVALGQYSSAILEYESILNRHPEDQTVRASLALIEKKAAGGAGAKFETDFIVSGRGAETDQNTERFDDGKLSMRKIFVDNKEMTKEDFEACWVRPSLKDKPTKPLNHFLAAVADRALMPLDKALQLVVTGSGLAYIPLEKYDFDVELARSFPREICLRWGILPFDRISKSILVATTNPYNRIAAQELEACTKSRLFWYLASPVEISKALLKIFR
jgi:tetratricopeptide (TPR) repeat protein